VLDWGTIRFVAPKDPAPLLGSLERLGDYDWVVFSSPRAVDAVASRVTAPPEAVKVAAVGPSTARALADAGWPVDRVPEGGSGAAVVEAFRAAGDAADAKIFFPASAIARDTIPGGLRALGARVDQVEAYRLETLPVDAAACARSMDRREVQVITFASPSAMEGLRAGVGDTLFRRMAEAVPAAAMGPTTGGALEAAGWHRVFLATTPDFPGLVEAARNAVRNETEG
jgi:uroporphyrinogen-III synthase